MHESPSEPAPVSAATRWAIRLPALGGLAVSALLLRAWSSGEASVPGCGQVLDCASVLASWWGYWWNLPVSLGGVFVFAGMILCTVALHPDRPAETRRASWVLLTALAVVAVGAAAWFAGLQLFVIGAVCPYCLAAHVCGVIAGVTVLWTAPKRGTLPVSLGAAALAVLIVGQWLSPAPLAISPRLGGAEDLDTGPGKGRVISVLGGKVRLEPHQFPTLGSPDARHIVVSLYDYTCEHCRALHRRLADAAARRGDDLGVVLLVTPLNPKCNEHVTVTNPAHESACEYAWLSLALWRAAPEKFSRFEAALLEGRQPPAVADARRLAEELAGKQPLADALNDPSVRQQVQRHTQVLGMTGRTILPQVLVPTITEQWFAALEPELGIRRVGP